MRLKIRVSPDGKEVVGLHSDYFPWNKLGSLEVKRASDVFFDSKSQQWRVGLLSKDSMIAMILPYSFDKRRDAIEYEIAYLQGRL